MEQYNISDLSQLYVYYINSILEDNSKKHLCNDQSLFTRFDSSNLSLSDFYKNLFLRMNCCLECYIISLIYITRINNAIPGIINETSIKNIVTSSLVLAQKFFDEICYRSDFYASFNQLSVWQINTLEVEFLCRIHFSLAVFPAEYEIFYNKIRNLCNAPSLKPLNISLPEIINIATSGCPLLKYVLTPHEQQKEAYYKECEHQRQSMMRSLPPVPKPIHLVPNLPYPLRAQPITQERVVSHPRSTEFYYPPPQATTATTTATTATTATTRSYPQVAIPSVVSPIVMQNRVIVSPVYQPVYNVPVIQAQPVVTNIAYPHQPVEDRRYYNANPPYTQQPNYNSYYNH